VFKKNNLPRLAISIYFFFSGLVFSSWVSRIPHIKDEFGFNEAELGGILFMLPLGSLAALPISGWLVQKFSSRVIGLLSILLYTVLLYGIAAAEQVFQLSVTLFLFGVVGNFCNIALNAQGLSIQERIKKPILSSLHAMWSLGAFVAAAISGWSMKMGYSTDLHFLLVAVLASFVALVLVYLFVDDVGSDGREQKIFVLPNRSLLLLGVICFCVAMTEGAMADWSSLYYRQVANEMHNVSTAGYTAFAFCMATGRFVGDFFIHRFGHSRVLKFNGGLILTGIVLALTVSIPAVVILGFALVGFGVSSGIPIVYMLSAKNKTMAPAAALAAVSSLGFTGFLIGPPIIGFIAQLTGLRYALTIVAIMGLIVWVLSMRVKSGKLS
jgi:MFS family permease